MWEAYFAKEKSLDKKSGHNISHPAQTEMVSYFIVADYMKHQHHLLLLLAQGVLVNSTMKTWEKWNISPHVKAALS